MYAFAQNIINNQNNKNLSRYIFIPYRIYSVLFKLFFFNNDIVKFDFIV